jgi:hypothetical protein
MRVSQLFSLTALAIVLSNECLLGQAGPGAAKTRAPSSEQLIRAIAAAQVRADADLLRAHPRSVLMSSRLPASLLFEHIRTIADVALWRVVPPFDHSKSYVVAEHRRSILRLGGFPSPELIELHAALRPRNLVDGARELAQYADPDGRGESVYPFDSSSPHFDSAASSAWRTVRPQEWPTDTVFLDANRNSVVLVTILTHASRSLTQHWTPRMFQFVFDSRRRLIAWSMREGEAISGVSPQE